MLRNISDGQIRKYEVTLICPTHNTQTCYPDWFNLYRSSDGRSVTSISSLGFQFLLLSRRTQVWFIVQEYLKNSQVGTLPSVDPLNIIYVSCVTTANVCCMLRTFEVCIHQQFQKPTQCLMISNEYCYDVCVFCWFRAWD